MLAILGSDFSVQWGAAIARGLIPSIVVIGASGIRVALAALILLAVFRPPLTGSTGRSGAPSCRNRSEKDGALACSDALIERQAAFRIGGELDRLGNGVVARRLGP